MSETITIREVDQQKTLSNVDKLKTKKQGGSYVYWVLEEEVQTTTKHITKNGTYKAKDDDKYGYSEVTVNVPGGNGSADSSGKPSGSIAPGGIGSAVVGTDPETGNDYAVGVDEDGNLVQTPVPSGIEIITDPTKTAYTAGETMDYTGLGAKMVNKDGSTFTDTAHPNGHLSMSELIFPVTVAPEVSGEKQATSDLDISPIVKPFTFGGNTLHVQRSYRNIDYSYDIAASKGVFCAWLQSGGYHFVVASESAGIELSATGARPPDVSPTYIPEEIFTENGKTVYYKSYGTSGGYSYTGTVPNAGTYSITGSDATRNAHIAWTMIYGTLTGGTAEIPVKWNNPYTGQECSDSFEITSTPGNHTSESSSGTEGAEGGGGF